MKRLGIAALLLATVLLAVACDPVLHTETGIVTSVASSSLVAVDGFQLLTADGRTLDFSTKGLTYGEGFPVQHLREHQTLAQPVMVTFRIVDGRNEVTKLQDAPAR
jgi:hypothetical protein